MLVNRIKCLFYCEVFRNNEHLRPDNCSLHIYYTSSWLYKINITWRLLDVRLSDLNLIIWSLRHPCLHHYGVKTSVSALSWCFYHILYIVSGISFHFIINGYGTFPSLRCTVYYPCTLFVYGFFLSLSSPSVPILDSITSFFKSNLNHNSKSLVI